MFTTDPSQAHRRERLVALDAAMVSPFARIEAHALWAYLTGQNVPAVVLFRNIAWYIVVRRISGWDWDPKKWSWKGLPNSLAGTRRRIAYALIGLLAFGALAFAGVGLLRRVDVASLFNAGRNTMKLKAASGNFAGAVSEQATTFIPFSSPTPTVATPTATPVTPTVAATTMPITRTAEIAATITGTRGRCCGCEPNQVGK